LHTAVEQTTANYSN